MHEYLSKNLKAVYLSLFLFKNIINMSNVFQRVKKFIFLKANYITNYKRFQFLEHVE